MAPKVEAFKTAVASATGVALDTVPLSNAHLCGAGWLRPRSDHAP